VVEPTPNPEPTTQFIHPNSFSPTQTYYPTENFVIDSEASTDSEVSGRFSQFTTSPQPTYTPVTSPQVSQHDSNPGSIFRSSPIRFPTRPRFNSFDNGASNIRTEPYPRVSVEETSQPRLESHFPQNQTMTAGLPGFHTTFIQGTSHNISQLFYREIASTQPLAYPSGSQAVEIRPHHTTAPNHNLSYSMPSYSPQWDINFSQSTANLESMSDTSLDRLPINSSQNRVRGRRGQRGRRGGIGAAQRRQELEAEQNELEEKNFRLRATVQDLENSRSELTALLKLRGWNI